MDLNYLLRRLADEQRQIATATCAEAARAHAELAAQYEARIAILRGEKQVDLRIVEG